MPAYTPAQAAKILQMAASSIRNHTTNSLFRPYFSPGATPPAGQARTLRDQDLRVLRFIAEATAGGATLQTVAERLAAGELEAFAWSGPVSNGQPSETAGETISAAQTLALALRAELSETRAREAELVHDLVDLTGHVGELRGQLVAKEQEIEHLRALLQERVAAPVPGFFARLLRRKPPAQAL